MILTRYFTRDILLTTLAVALVLLLIFMAGRFSRYLADVASGKISAEILFTLLLYHVPMILERVLPVSLFLGIMLVFGRMYVDNEVCVLNASGVSLQDLFRASLPAITITAVVVAVLCMYTSPKSDERSEHLLNQEKRRSELDLLEPGQFLKLKGGTGVIYASAMEPDRSQMRDVFITRQMGRGDWVVIRAETGYQQYDPVADERYLVLERGTRHSVLPGSAVVDRLHFSKMHQHLQPATKFDKRRFQYDTLPTSVLIGSEQPEYKATLLWRISLILLVPIVSLLAVGMSRTSPRQGRYIKLLPAMLLYYTYMMSLDVVRQHIASEDVSWGLGFFMVHVPFLLIAALSLWADELKLWWRARA